MYTHTHTHTDTYTHTHTHTHTHIYSYIFGKENRIITNKFVTHNYFLLHQSNCEGINRTI